MAEELIIDKRGKKEMYATLLPQIKALVEGESNRVANLANVAAALKQTFGFFWVGFYLVEDGELVLGPFQGRKSSCLYIIRKRKSSACSISTATGWRNSTRQTASGSNGL